MPRSRSNTGETDVRSVETFAQLYCSRRNLRPNEFTRAALAESLHWPARLLYLPLRIIHPDFLAADLDLINNAGRLRSPYELDLDITEYRYHPFNQSRLRRSLGVWLSTSRLRRLVFHTFLHEEEMR